MIQNTHHRNAKSDGEHGTTKSYVIGFILSLIFTAIPYYMVVQKVVSGNALLATIFGIAILQMIIQIIFFLHLGRGPKPLYNVVFFVSTVGIIIVVVGGSLFIMSNLKHSYIPPKDVAKRLAEKEGIYQLGGEKTGACQGVHENHRVTIKDSKVSPLHVEARLCDSLTFSNEDITVRELTFGTHPQHGVYAGEDEHIVRKGRSKSITLNQSGTYLFHDHIDPKIKGSFTVTPR